jgi:phosphohistidine phosphatase
MLVVLIHHADALGPAIDPLQPLSETGLAQAEALAGQARERGVAPKIIWHSGKLRARQTAEWFLRRCNPMAEFRAARGLLPADPPMWIHDAILLEDRDVLVVGHMPNVARLAERFGATEPLPPHGMMAFERIDEVRFEWRWTSAP